MNRKHKELIPEFRFPEFLGGSGWEVLYGNKAFEQISNKKHNSDLPILAITQEYGAIPREMIDYNVSVTDKSVQSYKVVDVGDFIISLRSFQGGIEYSGYKGLCSPAYVVLRNKEGIDKRFFKQYFKTQSFIRDLTKNLEGLRDGKMISYKQFSEILLPKPSLEEQGKIADCLESIDDLISVHAEKLDSLKTYKKGLMQQLFPIEGEAKPKERFSLFATSGEWSEQELGKKALKVGSGITPKGGDKNYKQEGRPFVRSQNVGWGQLLLDDIAYIDEETHSTFLSSEINQGDVLLNITGASIGRCAVVNDFLVRGNVNQHVCIIRLDKTKLIPDYLCQYILSNRGQKQIDSFQAGGNRQGLNFGQIRSFSIPIPPTIQEQEKIADCLSSIDRIISSQMGKIESLKTYKKGLMQRLFPSMEEVYL